MRERDDDIIDVRALLDTSENGFKLLKGKIAVIEMKKRPSPSSGTHIIRRWSLSDVVASLPKRLHP